MAKRFTDSEKWKDEFFQNIGASLQLFYIYVLDNCDCAGVWKINFKHFEFCTGLSLSKKEIEDGLGDRIVFINSEIAFLPKFIKFQYGDLSSIKSKVRTGIIKRLNFHNLLTNSIVTLSIPFANPIDTLSIPYGNSIDTVQEKEKEYININKSNCDAKPQADTTQKEFLEIKNEVFKAYQFNHGYPREIFDEFADEAWPLFEAQSDPNKNWKRFLTHYIKNSKHKIEDRMRDAIADKPYSQILKEIFESEAANV